jgi:hypothetical protein
MIEQVEAVGTGETCAGKDCCFYLLSFLCRGVTLALIFVAA